MIGTSMKTYYDIAGDGGSNILAQVERQQQAIRDSLSGVRHVLAVGSGKGGVGKSTFTMSLVAELHRRGHRMAIFDADFNGPCQAQLSGMTQTPWVPSERGLTLPRRADGIGVMSFGSVLDPAQPVEFGSVSSGDAHTWRATKEFTVLGQLLATVEWGELDFLVLDLPPGSERTTHFAEFLGDRVAFVLVTIPSDVSRGVVARSVSALAASGGRALGYVENMVGYYSRELDRVLPLFPPSRTDIPLPCLGQIPFDPALAALCDQGWPSEAAIEPSPARQAVAAIADRLLAALESER